MISLTSNFIQIIVNLLYVPIIPAKSSWLAVSEHHQLIWKVTCLCSRQSKSKPWASYAETFLISRNQYCEERIVKMISLSSTTTFIVILIEIGFISHSKHIIHRLSLTLPRELLARHPLVLKRSSSPQKLSFSSTQTSTSITSYPNTLHLHTSCLLILI